MNPSLFFSCPHCKEYVEISCHKGNFSCPHCAQHVGNIIDLEHIFDQCPLCGCRQFYTSKDFNQFIGCLVMAVGIGLAPFTFGLSLPVFALMDWLLYKRIKTLINCYRCGCEFRNIQAPQKFKPFMHHIGLKYDKYRK